LQKKTKRKENDPQVGVVGHLKKLKNKIKSIPQRGVVGYNKSKKNKYHTRGLWDIISPKKKGIPQGGLWDVRES